VPATQERYYDMLMERVREDRYASPQLLDRIELAIWSSEQFNEYLEMLVEKADQSWYTRPPAARPDSEAAVAGSVAA